VCWLVGGGGLPCDATDARLLAGEQLGRLRGPNVRPPDTAAHYTAPWKRMHTPWLPWKGAP